MDRVFSLFFTLSISIFVTVTVCGKIRGHGDLEVTADYTWIVTEWSECSASCGGVRVRSVQCVDSNGQVSELCHYHKPDTQQLCKKCNSEGVYWRQNLHHMHRVLTTRSRRTLQSENDLSSATFEIGTSELRGVQKQTTLQWTVSPWAACSATCGGGFLVRSVRCLDECGIISERCNGNKESRPSTYEFCGQIDCVTGIMDDGLLPPNGLTISSIPDGSRSSLNFFSSSIDRYMIGHNITENDGTLTILMQTVVNGMRTFSCQARPVDIAITVEQSMGQNVILLNGEVLFQLECVETTIIRIGQIVKYENSTVSVLGPNTEFPNITTFWYCDSFRCYKFNSSKSFLRSGPTSKLFTCKQVALYSIAGPINANIEDFLENPPVITTSSIPVTPSPTTTIVSSSFFTINITPLPSISISPSVLETTSVFTSVPLTTTVVFSPTPTSQLLPQTPSISSLISTPFEGITPTPTSFPIVTLTPSALVTPTPTDEAPPTTKKPEKTQTKTKGKKKCIIKTPVTKNRDTTRNLFIDYGTRTTKCCRTKMIDCKEQVSYDTTRRISTKTRGTVTKNKDTRTLTAKGPPSRMRSKTRCNRKKKRPRISTNTDERTRTSKALVGQLRGSTSRAPTTNTRSRGTATKTRGRGGKKRTKTTITRTKGTVNTRTRGGTSKKTRRKDNKLY